MIDLKLKILGRVRKDLEAIETALQERLNPYREVVTDVARHILFSGGKRIRPLLMVLSSRICGLEDTRCVEYSTLFEYLHAATLLHDDVVDGARLRRGKPVAHLVYGQPITVLVGDFLLARSLTIASLTGNLEIIKEIVSITENMSQGEIQQLHKKGKLDLSEQDYLDIIHRKTAVLIRGACRVGALLSGAGQTPREEALIRYGYHLGMAFQIADDLLDYTSKTEILGKEIGADLKEGKLTLPVIHAMSRADKTDRQWMEKTISSGDFSADAFQELLDMLNRHGGMKYARGLAEAHVGNAKNALKIFPESLTRETLMDIAEYTLLRKA
jgi:octaprenyl-diphosphate synthase